MGSVAKVLLSSAACCAFIAACGPTPFSTDEQCKNVEIDKSALIEIDAVDRAVLEQGIGLAKGAGRDPYVDEIRLKYFARMLAASQSAEFGAKLRKAIGERFDGDLNVLWKSVIESKVGDETIGSVLEKKLSPSARQLLSMSDIEEIPLLQVALPVNFDKWDGASPLLVAHYPLTTDDREWKTVDAYDQAMKKHVLSAKTPPQVPVLVVGVNERCDPKTGEILPDQSPQPKALGKSAAEIGQKIQVSFYCAYDNSEPWILGDAEYICAWEDGFNGENGFQRFTGIKSNKCYNKTFSTFTNTWKYPIPYAVLWYEDDGGTYRGAYTRARNCPGSFNTANVWVGCSYASADDDLLFANTCIPFDSWQDYSSKYLSFHTQPCTVCP